MFTPRFTSRLGAFLLAGTAVLAQSNTQSGTPATAKAQSPQNITGYWVALITEDWRFRMVTPRKGDYNSVPLNAEAKKIADNWDPSKDEAAGEQCKAYGAAALFRQPGRLHITWQDDSTLKIDMDAGTQTRLLHFGDWKSPGGTPTWQGESIANVEGTGVAGPNGASPGPLGGGRGANAVNRRPHLKVVTTRMRPGYLRKNGIPYSADATMTEYYDVIREDNGTEWLVVTTLIDDSKYLEVPFLTSTHFKKQADAIGWNPTPCEAR
jgi:hypothetical protein